MPDYEDENVNEEPVFEDYESEEPEQDNLIAGKFRSVDELARAYEEAQRKLHETSQEAAELKRMFEERETQNDYNNVAPPPTATEDDSGIWEQAIYDPKVLREAIARQYYEIKMSEAKVNAAIKKTVAAKKSDPHFNKVGDTFAAKLEELVPFFMTNADERVVQQVADDIWKQAVGDYYISNPLNNAPSPTRKKEIEKLGVERPTISTEEPEVPLSPKEKAALQALGLDNKAVSRAVKRAFKEEE